MELDLKTMYDQLIAVVSDIDEKLDSLQDTETAGKRKVGNELVEATKHIWGPVAENSVEQIKQMDPEVLTGVYLGLTRALRSAFDEDSTKVVEEKVASAPKTEPLITEAEVDTLQTQRREAYQQIKHISELAVSFKQAPEDKPWPLPAVRRGARGKRGKRALSYYDWSIDGAQVPEDSNTSAGVAKLLGFDKAKDFTEILRGDPYKIDTRKPPAEFIVEANGKQVRAVRAADAPSNEELEAENGDEPEVEDETVTEEVDETVE